MSYLSEGGHLVIDDSNIDAFIAMDQSDEKFPIGKNFHSHLVTLEELEKWLHEDEADSSVNSKKAEEKR
ncbi:hypothetical protein OZX62_04430 [Bifidobacterium sp. ESL0690]|uniref:hypothetical protein n=1 Tax=Bifidobacterium sp. ESL0690 TaxID=2983214 RepID=UPI0023F985FE|nr:hypothetical protein [Bifidobacterium sp. ESL0690]WEV47520.1 hypothetical protein OZX62_04430 [Bifidobacterium sp. ESL0690]